MKLLITLIFAFSVTVNAQSDKPKDTGAPGAGEGNGGGLVRQNRELKTLAEAGVMLHRASNMVNTANKYAPYYSVSADTVDEVKKIISLLPVSEMTQKSWADLAVKRGELLRIDDVDPVEYEKISADYAIVMKKFSQTFDPSVFILGAVTKDLKTNILPAFHQLNPRQQALILIHEFCFRMATDRLKKDPIMHLGLILELDTQIYKIIQASEKNQTVDPMLTLAILEDLGLLPFLDDLVAYNAIKLLQEKAGRPFLIEEFVLEDRTEYDDQEIDPHLMQEFNRVDSRALQIFENAKFDRFSYSKYQFRSTLKILEGVRLMAGQFCSVNFPRGSEGGTIFPYKFKLYHVRCSPPSPQGKPGSVRIDELRITNAKAVY